MSVKNIKERVSIIIPTFNGLKLLKENLPYLVSAIYFTGAKHEIIVVDDGSTDATAEYLKAQYPQIRTIRLPKNYGFARACNLAAKESKHSILLFLNNDIKVTKDFLPPLIKLFKEEDTFAVSPKIIASREKFIESIHETSFTGGYFCNRRIDWRLIEKIQKPFSISFASGACLAADRDKFFSLGGFDEIYHPYYWEDVDLSYRAWKRGWQVLYQPASVVYHERGATIGDGSYKPEVDRVFLRNMIIFTWKNLTDYRILGKHFFTLPFDLLFAVIGRRKNYLAAFNAAASKIKEILKKRKSQNKKYVYTDSEVLRFFADSASIIKKELSGGDNSAEPEKLSISGQAGESLPAHKRILIVHTHGGIGDLLLSTPIFSTLKKNYPDSYIALLVNAQREEVVAGNPFIDEIISASPEKIGSMGYLFKVLKIIKDKKFDTAIVLWSTWWEAYLVYLAGIETRVGQSGRALYSFLYNCPVKILSETGDKTSHWVEIILDYVRALDIEDVDRRLFFSIPQKDRNDISALFEKLGLNKIRPVICLHTGKGLRLDSSMWPVYKFAAIADKLIESLGAAVILTGGKNEVEMVNDVEKNMKHKAVNLAGELNLKQLGAVIENCDLLICPDSGPMHIAAALRTPVAAIFALKSDFPNRWRPYGTRYEIIRNFYINCPQKCVKEKCREFICMEQIREDDVVMAAKRLLTKERMF